MFVKPMSYHSTSRGFLAKSWCHGKFMATKIDGLLRQGMGLYGAIKPIADEAVQMYGGSRARQALTNIDKGVSQAAQRYQGAREQATKGGALVERLAGAIGGY